MSEIVRLEDVKKYYLAQKRGLIDGVLRVPKIFVKALDGVSITINEGSVIAIVGESGSGKTTLGKIIATLENATEGKVYFKGKIIQKNDLFQIRKKIDMVFQNPGTSLNPKMKVKYIVSEPIGNFDEKRVSEVISQVGLSYNEVKDKQAKELSGGQVQRVAIAKSLMKRPDLLVLDEPTSALDESIQAQVLNLLVDLQEQFKLTYLFITHNILVAKYISDFIAVVYAGKIVEYGSTTSLLSKPLHPYTQLLLSSVPTTETREVKPPEGDVPSLINLPSGCRFHLRCPFVMEVCKENDPPLKNYGESQVACWLYE